MRQFLCLVGLTAIVAGAAVAQSSNGYFFVAPGGASCCGSTRATVQLGAGGELGLVKGIGVGAELSALDIHQDLFALGGNTWLGVFSPNGYYHFFRSGGGRLDPFVTAGYTLLFRSGTANLFNFGGGATFWFADHLGVRFEFRDHLATDPTVNYWGFRFGLALR
jgi:hypothetical protein